MRVRAVLTVALLVAFLLGVAVCVVRADEAGSVPPPADADAPAAAASPSALENALKSEGLDAERLRAAQEGFEYQAEVARLMDILVHALYSKKEVFLRELVSNASDALDKLRYVLLSAGEADASAAAAAAGGDATKYEIRIRGDAKERVLVIEDTGVGMTKADLLNNLGTIASSGTRKFMEQIAEGADVNMIGQFGVGFYSAFVVADTITVTTKNDADEQYVWQSSGSSFTIAKDPRGNTLKRGTRITLALKEDASEYADEARLRSIIEEYSEFIDYPIFVWSSHEVEVEDEVDAEAEAEADAEGAASKKDGELVSEDESAGDDDDDDDGSADDGEAKTPAKKTHKETRFEWRQVNTHKPLWKRSRDEISDDDYKSFYRAMSKESDDPLAWTHFKGEGDHEFQALLYVPPRLPGNILEKMDKVTSVRLYVRRVFITDRFDDLLPRYLAFLFGVVDSDDLPLNVSREMLQQDKVLRLIKKKLTRKAIDMFGKMADDDEDKYQKFWTEFGKNIKLGVVEDQQNRDRLAKLLRFWSSKSGEKMTSLADYVSRMHENQTGIYYIAGESLEAVRASPHLEQLLRRGYEVLYLVDAIDEYTMQSLPEFDGHRLFSATKEGLKFGDETDADKEAEEAAKKDMRPVIDYLKKTLAKKVDKVTVSKRLADSPCVIVTATYGWSANMERIVRAQTLGDTRSQSYMSARKTLEINPGHALIVDLKKRIDAHDESAAEFAEYLYDTALLTGGFTLEDPSAFAKRAYRVLQTAVEATPVVPGASATADDADEDAHDDN